VPAVQVALDNVRVFQDEETDDRRPEVEPRLPDLAKTGSGVPAGLRLFLRRNTKDSLFPPLGQREAARQIADAYAWAGSARRFRDYAPDKEHCYDAEIQREALAWFDMHLKKKAAPVSP